MTNSLANSLLDYGCVQLRPSEPFTYASGLKGPIYCDNRQILSSPSHRDEVINAFIKLIKKENLDFDHFAGLATAGIPVASILADRLSKSLIYIRSKAKAHGKGNQIEGRFKRGDKVLLVEDLVNQGSSLEKAIIAAQDEGLEIVGCLSIVTYEMAKAKEVLKKYKVDLFSLINFFEITEEALEQKMITHDDKEDLYSWQKAPESWRPKV